MVVKIKEYNSFISDLEETYNSLQSFKWKLNPTKCVFDMPSGKLLGFIVSHRGIEANPEKINAIMNMEAPASIKDVQNLTGWMAALNRFLSRLGERDFLSSIYSRSKISSDGLKKQPMNSKNLSSISSHLLSSRPNAWRRIAPLYCGHHTHHQHGNCGRTQRRRTHLWHPMPCLLHQ